MLRQPGEPLTFYDIRYARLDCDVVGSLFVRSVRGRSIFTYYVLHYVMTDKQGSRETMLKELSKLIGSLPLWTDETLIVLPY
jgi:hypothetical protein